MTTPVKIKIVAWINPNNMRRGTKTLDEFTTTDMNRPFEGETVLYNQRSYTVLNVLHNLDDNCLEITMMLSDDIDGSGIEELGSDHSEIEQL